MFIVFTLLIKSAVRLSGDLFTHQIFKKHCQKSILHFMVTIYLNEICLQTLVDTQ